MTGKDGGKAAGAGLAGMIASVLTGADRAPGCGMLMRSNVRAMPAAALMATPAANLYRYALAHADHNIIRVRAHGTIRVSTTLRKPATAVTRHPSSGHAGGNSQSRADGDGMLGVNRPGAVRERLHWAGAGIETAWSMRCAGTSPDFQHAGAIRCTRSDA
ncbi:MAG TPA: hypothetical protein VNZ27_15095 [Rhodanobacter sp.]|nr:hypothetical protein [Rhodanobacter sp.]